MYNPDFSFGSVCPSPNTNDDQYQRIQPGSLEIDNPYVFVEGVLPTDNACTPDANLIDTSTHAQLNLGELNIRQGRDIDGPKVHFNLENLYDTLES